MLPDGIVTLRRNMLLNGKMEDSTPCGPHGSVGVEGLSYSLTVIVVKTAVARRTVYPLLSEVSVAPKHFFLTSLEAIRLMPNEHIMQVTQQMVITGTNYGLYVCTSELSDIIPLVLYCSPATWTAI